MELLGISEAARRIGVTTATLTRWDSAGKLRAFRDSARRRLYMAEDITHFIRERDSARAVRHSSHTNEPAQ